MSEPKETRGTVTPLISTAVEIAAESRNEVSKPEQFMTERTSITESKATYAKVVDSVYVRRIKNKKGQNKLCQRWTGPYRVLAQKSLFQVIFQLRNVVTGKQIETHIGNLKIVMRTQ